MSARSFSMWSVALRNTSSDWYSFTASAYPPPAVVHVPEARVGPDDEEALLARRVPLLEIHRALGSGLRLLVLLQLRIQEGELQVGVAELRVDRDRALERVDPLCDLPFAHPVSPGEHGPRACLAGIEVHRTAERGHGFLGAAPRQQCRAQPRMRVGERRVERDRPPLGLDRLFRELRQVEEAALQLVP